MSNTNPSTIPTTVQEVPVTRLEKRIKKMQDKAVKRARQSAERDLRRAQRYDRMIDENEHAKEAMIATYEKRAQETDRELLKKLQAARAEVEKVEYDQAKERMKYLSLSKEDRKAMLDARRAKRKELNAIRKERVKEMKVARKAYRREYWLFFRAARKTKAGLSKTWNWLKTGGLIGAALRKRKARKASEVIITVPDTAMPQAA